MRHQPTERETSLTPTRQRAPPQGTLGFTRSMDTGITTVFGGRISRHAAALRKAYATGPSRSQRWDCPIRARRRDGVDRPEPHSHPADTPHLAIALSPWDP